MVASNGILPEETLKIDLETVCEVNITKAQAGSLNSGTFLIFWKNGSKKALYLPRVSVIDASFYIYRNLSSSQQCITLVCGC